MGQKQSRRLFGQWVPGLFGLLFVQAWFSCIFQVVHSWGALSSNAFYFARGGVGLAAAALVLLASRFGKRPSEGAGRPQTRSAVVVALVLGAATLVVNAPWLEFEMARIAISAICGGGLTWMYLLYVRAYCRVSECDAICYILIWFLASGVLGNCILSMPYPAGLGLASVCPLLSALCLGSLRWEEEVPGVSADRIAGVGARRRSLAGLYISLVICGLAVGHIRNASLAIKETPETALVSFLLQAVICVILLVVTRMGGREFDISAMLECLFFVLIGATLILSREPASFPALSLYVSWCTRVTLVMLLWLILVTVCHRYRVHPVAVFGAGWGIYMLSLLVGTIFSQVTPLSMMDSASLYLLYLVLAAALVIVEAVRRRGESNRIADLRRQLSRIEQEAALLPDRPSSPEAADAVAVRGLSDGRGDGPVVLGGDEGGRTDSQDGSGDGSVDLTQALEQACRGLASYCDLTERESEIIVLTCKGFSKRSIGEQLFLSENTVKFHLKQVYAKLGIHSKDELLSVMNVK